MRSSATLWLSAMNLVLLSTHQADAAFWHEWDVFGVPGGLEFFLAFNVAAMSIFVVGLVHVAQGRASARRFAWLSAATGLVTVALHSGFLFRDRLAFWTPASIAVLGAIAVVSTLLLSQTRA